jgi:uncharacterized membrane protein YjjB (DUF3815 family)
METTNMSTQPADTQPVQTIAIVGEARREEFSWKTHSYLNEQIRFIDTKSAFVAALSTGLIGALYSEHVQAHFTKASISAWTWAGWAAIAAFIMLTAAVLMALISVAPRLRSYQHLTYIYWGGIAAHASHKAFYVQFRSEPMEALSEHLGHHVYTLATICRDKCTWLRCSILAGTVGGLLGGAVLLVAPVLSQTIPTK